MTDLHDKARAWFDSPRANDAEPTAIIAALLADNERLCWLRDNLMTDCNLFRARAEAAEAACENLGVTPEQAAAGLARFKAREARIAELEARYAALCEAEPVAVHSAYGVLHWIAGCELPPIGTALIPRPSMEGKP